LGIETSTHLPKSFLSANTIPPFPTSLTLQLPSRYTLISRRSVALEPCSNCWELPGLAPAPAAGTEGK
jgi:hypothetical protein